MLCAKTSEAAAEARGIRWANPAHWFRSKSVAQSAAAELSDEALRKRVNKYLEYIHAELEMARSFKSNLLISDVVSAGDNGSLQWVDLVLAGGGLLGIAHVGFVCVLEEAGIRFRGIGGTSAGAINAIIIAATRPDPTQESSQETLKILLKAPFESFQDGKGVKNSNDLLKMLLGGSASPSTSRMKLGWAVAKALPEIRKIWETCGLHPGNEFQAWVRKQLEIYGCPTVAALKNKMKLSSAGMSIRPSRLREDEQRGATAGTRASDAAFIIKPDLKLVASDIATQTKVVFPENANLYYENPDQQDPSSFVRASMSVPLFFQPYKISNIPKAADSVVAAWDKTKYPAAEIPDTATFVDGGTLSNFPISLFDVQGVPLLPTIGCQLGVQRGKEQDVSNPLLFYKAMNNTSRHIEDYDFVMKNPIYDDLVVTANTEGFGWLDFDMSDENKQKLFREGARAGTLLLSRFQRKIDNTEDTWTKIKRLRAQN